MSASKLGATHRSLANRLLIRLVHGYQHTFAWRPSPCRFVPSCSNYALEALEVHGARRGAWLSIRRLLRCHPWGPHGSDPVPRQKAP
jgi:putative membrane protein insertion efficiency factor